MAKTIYLATNVAGVLHGIYLAERDGVPVEDRVLVTAATGLAPVLASRLQDLDEVRPLLSRFGVVEDWSTFVAPWHPMQWTPKLRSHEARTARMLLESKWGRVASLVLVSLQASPARALANVFDDASITVYSDGLMAYGSVGKHLHLQVAERVCELVYLDLLDGLIPAAFKPYPWVVMTPLDVATFYAWANSQLEMAQSEVSITEPTAIIVEQYLADLGLSTPAGQAELLQTMHGIALSAGYTTIIDRRHPGSIQRSGAATPIDVGAVGIEAWLVRIPPKQRHRVMIMSVFSTVLFTARSMGFNAVAVGTERCLRTIKLENSNYLPVVLCDALLPTAKRGEAMHDARCATAGPLPQLLIDVIAYLRQPATFWKVRADLRRHIERLSLEQRALLRRYILLKDLANAGLERQRVGHQGKARKWWRRFVPSGIRSYAARLLHVQQDG